MAACRRILWSAACSTVRGKRRRAQAVSRFDADKKRYVPELEVLREWVTLSGIILGAAILPVAGAYYLALLTSW
jgi:hypothetical protein